MMSTAASTHLSRFGAIIAVVFASSAVAHVTYSPNSGLKAGGFFKSVATVPHGSMGYLTTYLEITIPSGVLSVAAEDVNGWNVTTVFGPVKPYISHGQTVTTGAKKIIYQAEPGNGLKNEHLMEISFSISSGCDFDDDATNTYWSNQYTLWWPTAQGLVEEGVTDYSTVEKWLNWTGVPPSNTAPWNVEYPNGAKPSPYIFISDWSGCTDEYNEDQGLIWFEENIEWVEAESEIDNKISELEGLIEEQMLTTAELADENMAALKAELLLEIEKLNQKNGDDDDDDDVVESLAIASFAISLVLVSVLITIALLRLVRPNYVYTVFSGEGSDSNRK